MTTPTLTKISTHIATQFPEFIRSEGPRFVEFLKSYYEQAEQVDEAVYAARTITNNQDIDATAAVLLEYFRREFLANIPVNILADRRLVTKHIRKFYRARGSADAYRFLFRILFNTEIDFYYPGDDILRCSDGRWVVETILTVGNPKTGDPTLWEGDIVTGGSSSSRGRVEGVTKSIYAGTESWELTLSNVIGNFDDEETITNTDTGEYASINVNTAPLNHVVLSGSGAFHENDNTLLITEPSTVASGAEGKITETNDLTSLTFKILRSGKGYRLNSRIIIGPSTGFGANFSITGLANTENININADKINSLKNVVLNTGLRFNSLGTNSTVLFSNLAISNVSSTILSALTFYANTVGRISQITLLTTGAGYNKLVANGIPTVTVIDDEISDKNLPDGYGGIKGRNANIVANNAPGALVKFKLTKPGIAYNKNEPVILLNNTKGIGIINETTIDQQQSGLSVTLRRQNSYSGIGSSIPGGLTTRKGRYTDTKGFLSWNNRLQDNKYYQEFSYVIKSNVIFDLFSIPVRKLLHPAGTQFFGTYTIVNDLNLSLSVDPQPSNIEFTITFDLNTLSEYLVIAATADSVMDSESISIIDESTYLDVVTNDPDESWTNMAGTIHFRDLTVIMAFTAVEIRDWANTHISFFVSESNSAMFGLGTSFTSFTPVPGETIIIVATSEATANGLYTITRSANNTFAEIAPPYAGNLLANGYVRF